MCASPVPHRGHQAGDHSLSAPAGLSDAAGRVSSSNNVVLGATDASEDKWRELDNQVGRP